jgi:hypothetical protein
LGCCSGTVAVEVDGIYQGMVCPVVKHFSYKVISLQQSGPLKERAERRSNAVSTVS